MQKFELQSMLQLEASIISQWQQEFPKISKALEESLNQKHMVRIIKTCFRNLVLAATTKDAAKLKVCARFLTKTQRQLSPQKADLLFRMILSLKQVLYHNSVQFEPSFLINLEDCADQLVVLFGEYLSRQLSRQKQLLSNKERQLKRRGWELTVLNSSSACIKSTLDVHMVLESILGQVAEIMGTDICAIYELDSNTQQLQVIAQRGLIKQYTENVCIPVGQGVVGKAVESGRPVVLSNVLKEWTANQAPEFILPVLDDINFGAILAVPLICKERTLGCISVYHKRPYKFPRAQQSLLSIFADHAALAIENARLHQKAKELAVVQERNRIARDLHDSVCQSMFSIVLNAEACRYLMVNNAPRALEVMGRLEKIAQEALAEMRSLIFELRPAALKEKGLIEALKNHVDIFRSRNGIDVQLIYEDVKRLPEDIELCLYRVGQEAMTNVAKHASAQSIEIKLQFMPRKVTFLVTDNGRGFDVGATHVEGKTLGLVTMRERVEACGGQLEINSIIGSGTTVKVCLPFREVL